MTEYAVYLLMSEMDGNYYIGYTGNLNRRLSMHHNGQVKSTRNRRPLTLLGYKAFSSKKAARYFEYEVKHHSDKKRSFVAEMLEPSGPEVRAP